MNATMRHLLVFGGTSDVGYAVACAYASAGWDVTLAVRDAKKGTRNVRDLNTRYGVATRLQQFDACAPAVAYDWIDCIEPLPDTAICVVGLLGDQRRGEHDALHAQEIQRTNMEGPCLLLGRIANRMEARGSGTIIGISSVAGERGRASNYLYGAGKAGFTTFLSGLRHRLANKGVQVVTVKLGFARTRMTAGMPLPRLLTAEPGEVGSAIYRAAELRKRDVVYLRPIWRPIMAVITHLPESIFKRLSI